MRSKRALLTVIAGLLGVATVLLPAIASSETPPTVRAYAYGAPGNETRYWLPQSATVAEGGTVRFSNPSGTVNHGLEFTGGPAKPECAGLPAGAGEATGATSWQAECSFAKAGTYTFICTVHPVEMKGTVTVTAAGTTTSVTTTTTTPTTSTGPGPSPGAPPPPAGATAPGSLLAGAASQAYGLRSRQHGHLVRGSLVLAAAAAGATLRLELSTLLDGHRVVVGRLTRESLTAGRLSFTVALDARARRALQRHGRLALQLRLQLAVGGASALTLRRAVTLSA